MPPNPAPSGMRLSDLATRIGATLDGDGDVRVDRVATLEDRWTGNAVLSSPAPAIARQLAATRAAAVIVAPALASATALPKFFHANPYAAYAKAAGILHPAVRAATGVHPSAIVGGRGEDRSAARRSGLTRSSPPARRLPRACRSAPACAIGADVDARGGRRRACRTSTIYARVAVGARTIIHGGAVIGSDGFGMAEDEWPLAEDPAGRTRRHRRRLRDRRRTRRSIAAPSTTR